MSDLLGVRTGRGYGGVGEDANKMHRMREAMQTFTAESNRLGTLMDRAYVRNDNQAVQELARLRWQNPGQFQQYYKQWLMKKQNPTEYYKQRLPLSLRGSF